MFNGKPIGLEKCLNRIIEALGIIIDRGPKKRLKEKDDK